MNALELMTMQHREAEELFEGIRTAEGADKIAQIGQLAESLLLHSALEERFIYPAARGVGFEELVSQSTEEYAQIKCMVTDLLRTRQDDPSLDAKVDALRQQVQAHVQREETELFPKLSSSAAFERLNARCGDLMREALELQGGELLKGSDEGVPAPQ